MHPDPETGRQMVVVHPDPETREQLLLAARWFDTAKRLNLGPEAYANYVFES